MHYYYLCPNYAAQLERSGCTYKFVPEEKLIGAVESIAAKEIMLAADLEALAMQKAAQHLAASEEAGRALKGRWPNRINCTPSGSACCGTTWPS